MLTVSIQAPSGSFSIVYEVTIKRFLALFMGVTRYILLIFQLLDIIETRFLCLNIYFGGQQIQWEHFKIFIFGDHLEIQDGHHGTFVFVDLLYKSHTKVSTVGWKSI